MAASHSIYANQIHDRIMHEMSDWNISTRHALMIAQQRGITLAELQAQIQGMDISILQSRIDDLQEKREKDLLHIVIYLKCLELDPEWISTLMLHTFAIEKSERIKQDMKDLEDMKMKHQRKFGTWLQKFLN